MEMKKLTSGKLRAIGYDAPKRLLRVELDGGIAIDYHDVGADLWRRFANSGVAWSFYRDNIEEEFHGTKASAGQRARPAELDALFGDAQSAPETDSKPLPPGVADLFSKPGEST
ncbi:MAG: hypothetical protein JWP59_323 [Massilia sp.]|nr:hypothetical protein [Massilia sp.]